MDFRIADTFTYSLARLTGDEQKAVKTTAFDLQMNSANPGMSLHKLDRAKDKNFWSVRVNADIRLIVHKTAQSLLLCYVDHHDKAYHWAERRKLETHPTTGAAQLVEIRERIQEIVVQKVVERVHAAPQPKPLFSRMSDAALMGYGVPAEWLADVRAATEDNLLELTDHLPGEAAEALLQLATGGTPVTIAVPGALTNPLDHPDAQRRFRVMRNVEELERALAYPWERWATFLHPQQRELVERDFSGPAKVAGSAGTGKTIVALHRAAFLAQQNADGRVLLTTFSEPLANALRVKLRRLIGNQPRLAERLEVGAIGEVAARLYQRLVGPLKSIGPTQLSSMLDGLRTQASEAVRRFSTAFLLHEWQDTVDAWQLDNWPAYRDLKRLGRKRRLSEAQRQALWSVFEHLEQQLAASGLTTEAAMYTRLAARVATLPHPVFEHIVVDEAQDLSVAQLRFLAALAGGPVKSLRNGLFFAGDLGQRIFQTPFSWRSLGVDIRGRSRTLHINYRTSHQIRQQADQLLGAVVADVDGNAEERRGTVSAFNGPTPLMVVRESATEEQAAVADWLRARRAESVEPHEIGIFVRSNAEIARATAALTIADIPYKILDERIHMAQGLASISTMHLAKGLEFRVVAVMACDDEVIPSQTRIESVTDEAELEEVYETERHLLYVACTRARDQLLVSGVAPESEFIRDLNTKPRP